MRGTEGDLNDKDSPGHKLGKARRAVWEKEAALIGSLRQHSAFTAGSPPSEASSQSQPTMLSLAECPGKIHSSNSLDPKFTRRTFSDIEFPSLVNYLAYALQTLSHDSSSKEDKEGADEQH